MQVTERFGRPRNWREQLEGIYFVLRERATSEFGMFTATPKGSAPAWCDFFGPDGAALDGRDWSAAQAQWAYTVRCATPKITTVEELNDLLTGVSDA